ncbi:MAG: CDP-alcohol phosphatidyltransferase family protein [Actinomycetales bacterium]
MTQPPSIIGRRSGEHWAGVLYMRYLSIYATRIFVRVGASPNGLTAGMIVVGLLGAVALLWSSVWGAVLSALLIQLYLLLDCSDGEVARWTGRLSLLGVYLDRVGHYVVESAVMVAAGIRAAHSGINGYALVGAVAGLGVVLIKAETDLVDVARARAGMPAVTDEATTPRSSSVARARALAARISFHRIIGGTEASLLLLVAGIVDVVAGSATAPVPATRVLVVAFLVVAVLQWCLHLASIVLSSRLR